MIRMLSLPALLLSCAIAAAQAPPQLTVTADGVVTVTIKPDQAKIYLNIDSKAGDASSVVEVATTARKELVAAIEKIGLKGVTATVLPQKITKDKTSNQLGVVVAPGGAQAPPPPDSYSISQLVICTVAQSDPVKLGEAVEKITQTAAAQGITGDKAQSDSAGYNPFGGTMKHGARVTYSSKDGWENALSNGLTNATAKALSNASALARGAGLKVGDVVSVVEVPDAPAPANTPDLGPYARIFGISPSSPGDDEYVDGDLVRKVRVRVKVAVTK